MLEFSIVLGLLVYNTFGRKIFGSKFVNGTQIGALIVYVVFFF